MDSFGENLVQRLSKAEKERFELRRTVMSFQSYLDEVERDPAKHLRSSAQYFSDLFSYFGSYELEKSTGQVRRWKLFDAPFEDGEGQVLGQERVQNAILKNIQNFVKAKKCDRLVLLHGPNGSAKTSLVRLIFRAAEIYSQQEEGAIYRFNWVFPQKTATKGSFGFSEGASEMHESFAQICEEQIEAKIRCEIGDHPIFLLNSKVRAEWIERLTEDGSLSRDFAVGDFIRKGELSSKNRNVFQALLTNYLGDLSQVFKHIQVERFYFSSRYRTGLGSVEPQMSVDAYVRQLTMDQSVSSLPSALRHISLYESGGPLVDGNRGMVEYNDLLKRPMEAWKYLLVATELGQVNVENITLFFDTLMLGSSNELHLQSFREYPDWQSFKGRIELIKVPYLLKVSDELKIYQSQMPRALNDVHIAPGALEVAARWAVLTRLEAPKLENYSLEHRDLVTSLAPWEKLELYDSGRAPERFTQSQAREIKQLIKKLHTEFDSELEYEGRFGASPREMRTLLLSASQDPRYDHLSPVAVLDEITKLVKEKASYEFLRRPEVRGYRNAESFIEIVKQRYLADLAEGIRSSVGLVDMDSHKNLLERYIKHVSAWTKGEKLLHPVTKKSVEPDSNLMNRVEMIIMSKGENVEEFRRSLISQIGAQKLEHPEEDMDYSELFATHLKKLRDDYFEKQRKVIEQAQKIFLTVLEDGENSLDHKEREMAHILKENLKALGYNESSARNAMSYLLKNGN